MLSEPQQHPEGGTPSVARPTPLDGVGERVQGHRAVLPPLVGDEERSVYAAEEPCLEARLPLVRHEADEVLHDLLEVHVIRQEPAGRRRAGGQGDPDEPRDRVGSG